MSAGRAATRSRRQARPAAAAAWDRRRRQDAARPRSCCLPGWRVADDGPADARRAPASHAGSRPSRTPPSDRRFAALTTVNSAPKAGAIPAASKASASSAPRPDRLPARPLAFILLHLLSGPGDPADCLTYILATTKLAIMNTKFPRNAAPRRHEAPQGHGERAPAARSSASCWTARGGWPSWRS